MCDEKYSAQYMYELTQAHHRKVIQSFLAKSKIDTDAASQGYCAQPFLIKSGQSEWRCLAELLDHFLLQGYVVYILKHGYNQEDFLWNDVLNTELYEKLNTLKGKTDQIRFQIQWSHINPMLIKSNTEYQYIQTMKEMYQKWSEWYKQKETYEKEKVYFDLMYHFHISLDVWHLIESYMGCSAPNQNQNKKEKEKEYIIQTDNQQFIQGKKRKLEQDRDTILGTFSKRVKKE